MPGAEGDAGVGQLQAEQTAAQQIQNLVADEGVVHIGRQGAGHRAAAVADQHKGALADAGGHVGGGKVRAGHLHSGQRTACGCIPSKDIGAYDSCPHFCVYCYANRSEQAVRANLLRCRQQQPEARESLLG